MMIPFIFPYMPFNSVILGDSASINSNLSLYVYVLSSSPSVLNFALITYDTNGNFKVTSNTTFLMDWYGRGNLTSSIQLVLFSPYTRFFAVRFNYQHTEVGNSSSILTGGLSEDLLSFFFNGPMSISSDPAHDVVSNMIIVPSPTSVVRPIIWLIVFVGVEGANCTTFYYQIDFGSVNFLLTISVESNLNLVCAAPLKSSLIGGGLFQVSNAVSNSLVSIDFDSEIVKTVDITTLVSP
eukprot:TRINITY_DN712_c0_g2_i1.p1 TRINITY_DN712_c0_g2~~TRINITY_DN712_c0_g2_i1.p1  ORF type:complete len:238 (+),score=26.11 TRINITY_DN712_c0_g2_i1:298-1011(+)